MLANTGQPPEREPFWKKPLDGLELFFSTWRFPVFTLTSLLSFKAVVLTILAIPPSPTAIGRFAEQFKIWCFGYKPETGEMEMAYVGLTIMEPLVLAMVIAAIWYRQLRMGWQVEAMRMVPYMVVAGVCVTVATVGLVETDDRMAQGKTPEFPAASLRTSFAAPAIALSDEEGRPFLLASERGRVVLVTAVYASCTQTCPMILGQTKRVVKSLTAEQTEQITVAAITLDPERDNQTTLSGLAAAQGVRGGPYRFLWGPPDRVNPILDRLSIARERNPDTGVIEHANILALVDRQGKLAYRFSLGDVQETWLREAIVLLLSETPQG